MDATALRWVLAIIGVIVVVGIYLYSVYQGKLRRRAAIKTFTHEEIESGFIEDESLRNELHNINTRLNKESGEKQNEAEKEVPAEETVASEPGVVTNEFKLPQEIFKLPPEQRIAHVLKPLDNHLLGAQELLSAFNRIGFELDEHYRMQPQDATDKSCVIFNLTEKGTFKGIDGDEFTTHGIVFFINITECHYALGSYEAMLKKVDELVRVLELKVYSDEFELLTLQHVTDIRRRLLEIHEVREQED